MKMMKLALLGTAALAVSALGAQANDLDALKAEIEALNARVAQLETAPAVPAGYSLMTMSDIETISLMGEQAKDLAGYAGSRRISVLPTADAPAAATVDWDFQIRAAIFYRDFNFDDNDDDDSEDSDDGDDDEIQVVTRGRIRVKASMDTAVGAVGVDMRLQGSSEFGDGAVTVLNIAWGWWQFTPEAQFGAGYTGSLGNVPFGQDENITGIGTTVFFNPGDQEQMRLTWVSGPVTLAGAVEDSKAGTGAASSFENANRSPDFPGFAGRAGYAGDTFSAAVSAFIDDEDDRWQLGGGATAAVADIATISVAAAVGDAGDDALDRFDLDPPFDFTGDTGDYWGASIYGRLDVSEQTYVEASYGFLDSEAVRGGPFNDFTRQAFDAGIYHSPVDQLVFGLEANYLMIDVDGCDSSDTSNECLSDFDADVFQAAFITFFNL